MSLHIEINEKGSGLHEVVLDGRLDTDTYAELEARLKQLFEKKLAAVRFNMAQLNYISSMGIRVILKAFKTLRARKVLFLMADLQPQIKKVFDIAQALPPETVFASVKEADEYFDAMQRKVLEQDRGEG